MLTFLWWNESWFLSWSQWLKWIWDILKTLNLLLSQNTSCSISVWKTMTGIGTSKFCLVKSDCQDFLLQIGYTSNKNKLKDVQHLEKSLSPESQIFINTLQSNEDRRENEMLWWWGVKFTLFNLQSSVPVCYNGIHSNKIINIV